MLLSILDERVKPDDALESFLRVFSEIISNLNFVSKVRQALGGIPIVDDEIRRAAGTASETATEAEDESAVKMAGGAPKHLVTADGTYASQSAFSASTPSSRYFHIDAITRRSVGRSVGLFCFSLLARPCF